MGAALWNSLIDWGINDVRRMAISHSTANSGGVNDDIDAAVLGGTCRTPMSTAKKPKGKAKTLAQANRQSAPCDALNDALVICAGEIQKVPSTQEAEAADLAWPPDQPGTLRGSILLLDANQALLVVVEELGTKQQPYHVVSTPGGKCKKLPNGKIESTYETGLRQLVYKCGPEVKT